MKKKLAMIISNFKHYPILMPWSGKSSGEKIYYSELNGKIHLMLNIFDSRVNDTSSDFWLLALDVRIKDGKEQADIFVDFENKKGMCDVSFKPLAGENSYKVETFWHFDISDPHKSVEVLIFKTVELIFDY